VYKEATELCAYLCKEYKLDPMADGVIIGHYEGHKRGIASNHADPGHWFPKHGKSMDTFRAEVKKLLSATRSAYLHRSRRNCTEFKSVHTLSKQMLTPCSRKLRRQDLRMLSLNIRDNYYQARGA
jgi:hypothetical protein